MPRFHFLSFFLPLCALLLGGCGAAQNKDAASYRYGGSQPEAAAMTSGTPGASPDRDGDAVTDEVDSESLYEMPVSAPAEMDAPAIHLAQAAPPPPAPAPGPTTPARPAVEKKMDAPTMPEPAPQPNTGGGAKGKPAGPNVVAAPMLIYTADVNLAVFEVEKILDSVERLAKDTGGYLVERQARRIVIRVPSGDFDGAMLQIAKLGDVLQKNVTVEDVTEQFFDLQVRIRNLEVVRNRMEELLKKADKVADAIAVERELERVTTELERLKGRAKLLGELVRFSTITVNVSPQHTDRVGSKVRLPFPWLNTLGLGELLRL